MGEKRRLNRRLHKTRQLIIHLNRLPENQIESSSECVKENRTPTAPHFYSWQLASTSGVKEEPRPLQCLFHTELDLRDEIGEEHSTHCMCGDCLYLLENKENTKDIIMQELTSCTHFENMPPLRNLHETIGIQTVPNKKYKYNCKVCFSEFNNLEYFKHHESFHCQKLLGCAYCNATFPNKKKLRIHIFHHMNKNFFECIYCRAAFENKNDLQKHVRTHQTTKLVTCTICKAKFEKLSDMEKHKLKHIHSSSGNLVHVFRKIKSSSDPVPPAPVQKPRTGHKFFGCKKCAKLSFTNQRQLRFHELIHTRKYGAYVCDVCDGKLTTSYFLEFHKKRAH